MKYDSEECRKFEQECRVAGELIDPATAEMLWHWASVTDPYGVLDRRDENEEYNIGRIYFLRESHNKTWICAYDLPEATLKKFWQLLEAGHYQG
jgi:hypothetical protein